MRLESWKKWKRVMQGVPLTGLLLLGVGCGPEQMELESPQDELTQGESTLTDTPPSVTFTHLRKVHINSTRPEIVICQVNGGGSSCDYSAAGFSGTQLVAQSPASASGLAAAVPNTTSVSPNDYWNFSSPYSSSQLYVPLRGIISAGTYSGQQCYFTSFSRARLQLSVSTSMAICYNETSFLGALQSNGATATINLLASVSSLFNIAASSTSPEMCATRFVRNEMVRYTILLSGTMDCGGTLRPFFLQYPRPEQGTGNIFFQN